MRKLALGLVVALGAVGTASAADLPVKAPAYQVAARGFNWTGVYIGANAGYGWGSTSGALNTPVPGNFDLDGWLAGGQIGANYQFANNILLGLEADYQWANIDGDAAAGGVTASSKLSRFGTLRGRVGYAWDRSLFYATGGWAFGGRLSSTFGPAPLVTDRQTLSGWTAGVGYEYAFAPAWSAKVEYLHIDFDQKQFFPTTGCGALCNGGADVDLVRVGLNYRFGGM